MIRRIFLDTEFKNLPWTGQSALLWVGVADEDGHSWSAINADVAIDDTASEFTKNVVVPRMPEDEPRLRQADLAARVRQFCGQPDEFWAWCPTAEDLADRFDLGSDAPAAHAKYWDWDLQLLKRVVTPWPSAWPTTLRDLNQLVRERGIQPPSNDRPHHPRYDALWNRDVFQMINEIRGA